MPTDQRIETAIKKASAAADNLQRLQKQSEPNLFVGLALRTEQTIEQRDIALTFDAPLRIDDLPMDRELQSLGRRIFLRWSRTLHQFVCVPDKEDADIRERLLSALTGAEGGAAVIAGVLVACFGASPANAAIIAALLLKIIIVPAGAELCEAWKKTLSQSAS
jgi:hypothetical protein